MSRKARCAHWQDTHRVNHSVQFMDKGVCTNQAESYFSRLRRMEIGTHHHIAGPYIGQYAREASWREDDCRVPNGTQFVMAAEANGVSNRSCMEGLLAV